MGMFARVAGAIALVALVGTAAWAGKTDPPELAVVASDFTEVPHRTPDFVLGDDVFGARFHGNAAAATLGISELYTSPPRAWIISPRGVGVIDIRPSAGKVSMFARTRSLATQPTIVVAEDANGQILRTEVLDPDQGFRQLTFRDGVARIFVINLDNLHFSSVDDVFLIENS